MNATWIVTIASCTRSGSSVPIACVPGKAPSIITTRNPWQFLLSSTHTFNRLYDHKIKLAKLIKERQTWQEQAERLLKTTELPRNHRAGIFQTETHLKELSLEAEALRKSNDRGKSLPATSGFVQSCSLYVCILTIGLKPPLSQLERASLHYVPSWRRDGQISLAPVRSATHPTAQGQQSQPYYSLNQA